MWPRTLVVVQRLALLAAILASAALIIDYQNIGDPTFCGAESSCFKVRASDLGRDLAGYAAAAKMTVPHVGVLAHVILLALALAASTRNWLRLTAAASTVGALGAVYLLVAQLRIGELCPWCAVVDTSSIIAAVCAVLLARAAQSDPEPQWGREAQTSTSVVVWSAAAAAMVGIPHFWSQHADTAPLPESIQALQVPGKVTVVSFTDFECPFCRKLAPTLEPLHDDPAIAFKRYMAPLDMHVGARPAALAYLCVEPAKQDAFAALLYEAPDGSFSPGNLAWMAKKLGVNDEAAFQACMKDPATEKKLDEQITLFKDAGGAGLPTTWIGRRTVKGFQPDKVLRAIDAEKGGSKVTLPIWGMFVVAGAVGAWTAAMHLRAARAVPAPDAKPKRRSRRRDDDRADETDAGKTDAGKTDADASAEASEAEVTKPKKPRRQPATTMAATPAAKRSRAASERPPADPADEPSPDGVVASAAPENPTQPAEESDDKT